MFIHIAEQGECLSSIAARFGFSDYKIIYDHPDNAELKKERTNPNVIFPGDRVTIPDLQAKVADAATAKLHRYVAERPTKELRVVIRNHDGTPLKNEPCVLHVGASTHQLSTDGSGLLRCAVDFSAREATLEIAGNAVHLHLGKLNPLKATPDNGATGTQARLRNLGYQVPDTIDPENRSLQAALTLFQQDAQLPVTGKLDPSTLRKLEELHGC